SADVLRSVVTADHARLPTPLDDLLQRADHPGRRQRQVDLDAQAFAVKVIQYVEQPEAAAVAELVVHEVHRPDLVDRIGHRQRLGLLAHQAFPWLDPQVQLQLPVDAVDPLVIPAKALDVAQVQEAQAEAPVAIRRGQSHQPIGDPGVIVRSLGSVPVTGLTDLEGPASVSDARAPAFDRCSGHLPALRWPHHFFDNASFNRSALSWASAYIFFRRRFSSCNSLSWDTIDASMPPNLLRHL